MATLDPGKLEEIAQYLNGFNATQLTSAERNALFALGVSTGNFGAGFQPVGSNAFTAFYEKWLAPNGLAPVVDLGGEEATGVATLIALTASGVLTADEAEAFLTSKYGVSLSGDAYDLSWVPVLGGKVTEPQEIAEAAAADASDGLTQSEQPPLDQAVANAKTAAGLPSQGSVAPLPYIYEPQIADDAEPGEIAQEVALLSDSIVREVSEIRSGRGLSYPPNTISGDAIIAGTLPASKLELSALYDKVGAHPSAEQAVKLNYAVDGGVDHWLEATTSSVLYRGPARVQRVTSFDIPPTFQPERGLVRYRILRAGVKLTVLGVRVADAHTHNINAAPIALEVQYGFVLTGIPDFLKGSQRKLLYAAFSGDVPASLTAERTPATINSKTFKLFDAWADETFRATPQSLFTEFAPAALSGSSSRYLTQPSWSGSGSQDNYLNQVRGFAFQLVSGRQQDEVYAQLNGRQSAMYPHIGGQPAGDRVSVPEGFDAPPPCTAGAVLADSVATNWLPLYAPGTPSSYFTSGRVIQNTDPVQQGVPFLGEDCHRLREKEDSFSLVVQVWPPKLIDGPNGYGAQVTGDCRRPATWGAVGLEIDPQNGREIAVDIVVA